MRVLDVGAGAGKVCTVGALSGRGMWWGVEQHGTLVQAARRVAVALGVTERTNFVHADAFTLDWRDFDALYLYNPFELTFAPCGPGPEASRDLANQALRTAERLASLRHGTRVVTFNGFGGEMPPSYRLAYHERVLPQTLSLSLWIQEAPSQPGYGDA
jgi:hypothetical protein